MMKFIFLILFSLFAFGETIQLDDNLSKCIKRCLYLHQAQAISYQIIEQNCKKECEKELKERLKIQKESLIIF